MAIPSKQACDTLHGLILWLGGSLINPSVHLVFVVVDSRSNGLYGFIYIHLSFHVVLFDDVPFKIRNGFLNSKFVSWILCWVIFPPIKSNGIYTAI